MSPFMLDFVNPFWCESVLTFPAETNSAYNPGQYSCMVQAAVEDYRQIWRIRGAPLYFGFFQMPSVRWIVHLQFALNSVVTWIPLTLSRLIPPTVLTWAVHIIRWKQTNEIGYLPNERMPNTFMAVTHDLYGVRGDAHEIEKQPWVKRIIPGTLQQNNYHFKNICFSGHLRGYEYGLWLQAIPTQWSVSQKFHHYWLWESSGNQIWQALSVSQQHWELWFLLLLWLQDWLWLKQLQLASVAKECCHRSRRWSQDCGGSIANALPIAARISILGRLCIQQCPLQGQLWCQYLWQERWIPDTWSNMEVGRQYFVHFPTCILKIFCLLSDMIYSLPYSSFFLQYKNKFFTRWPTIRKKVLCNK